MGTIPCTGGYADMYYKLHSGFDDHLEWPFSVIGSHPKWWAEEPQKYQLMVVPETLSFR